jgi:hypothetical protein
MFHSAPDRNISELVVTLGGFWIDSGGHRDDAVHTKRSLGVSLARV